MLGLTASSLNIEYLMADILEESRNPAIKAYRAAYIANSSNSTPNSNSNPSKKGKNKKKGKKKASYNVKGQNNSAKSAEQASFILGSYNLAIEEEEESNSSSNSRYKKRKDFKGKGLKTSSNKAKYKDNKPRRRPRDPALYNSWLYDTGSTDHISNSKERTEECKLLAVLGSKTYLVYIPSRRAVLKTSTIKFIEDNTVLSQPTNNTALKEELVDLDLDLEGAVSPDPSNLNTKKPISIEIGPSKLESYESSSDSKLDKPSPDKPINPVIVESTRPTISIRKPELPEAVISKDSTPTTYKQVLKLPRDKRSKWLEAITKEFIQLLELGVFKFLPRSLLPSNRKLITYQNVLKVKKDAKNRPIKYKSRLVARGFIQVEGLDYIITYASTSIPPTQYILLAIDAVLDWEIEQADFIGAFHNSALKEEIYIEIPKRLLDLAASNKAIYKLLLKYDYNPSTPNIIKLSKALYSLKQSPREWQDKLKVLLKSLGYLPLILDPGVFYNAKTCYFIVTYIDDCLFIGPNIGYLTDLKKRLNKVYTIEDLGPAAYFLGLSRSLNRPTKSHLNAAKNLFKYLNSTKDYSICFSYNGNTVANLGPKLSNSSNTTTKLSRDFHSKEGPRPLTTTSTTIVDSRNSKGSSWTCIINSSLVPIGFSDSDFTGDKAIRKSTYSYLYKLAGRPISWKTKRATTIALSTLEAETNGLTEAIREVQWIIGLFSELYRPIDHSITLYRDNQGSITVANDPALYARTKHTLLKFRYVREQVKAKIVTIIYLNTKCS
ncbi:hypothetical protein P8C59_003173 [Phyllachora maydis]|uniref:Reverse transcriptase Ty1/copia-type domain-containing protein n=1 Tax=Phyllachora maydis TaxID=1825666 RepID=A0AAD9HZR2_9PEZI|nr:hypothetical protein P8C59_003173 [Phyllachora maydis]